MLSYIRHMVRAMIKVEPQAIKGITVHPHGSVHAPPCNGRLLFADIVLHPAWDDLEVRLPSLLAARALPVLCQPTPRSPGLAASHGVRLCLTARRMRLRLAGPHAQVRAAGGLPSLSSCPPPYPPYVTRHINHGPPRWLLRSYPIPFSTSWRPTRVCLRPTLSSRTRAMCASAPTNRIHHTPLFPRSPHPSSVGHWYASLERDVRRERHVAVRARVHRHAA